MELPLKMRQEYLSRRRNDLETLRASTPLQAPFKVLGHQMRGNARSYGFESLEPLAVEMEKISADTSSQHIDGLLSRFASWIENEERRLSSIES